MTTPLRVPIPTKVTRDTDLRIASVVDEPWYQDYIDSVVEVSPPAAITYCDPSDDQGDPEPILRILAYGVALFLVMVAITFSARAILQNHRNADMAKRVEYTRQQYQQYIQDRTNIYHRYLYCYGSDRQARYHYYGC